MQGWRWRALGCVLLVVLALVAARCREGPDPAPELAPPAGQPAPAANLFNPAEAGSIRGRVTWAGMVPQVPPFRVKANPSFWPHWPKEVQEKTFPNPNAPAIHPGGGVGNAVVFLRQVDPQHARPWDHHPVTVGFRDYQLQVGQGKEVFSTGFVHTGDAVKFVSLEDRFHILRARQGAFFALTLPEPNQPRQRRLTKPGIVELTSGAEYYWARAYLFVADHPYYTRTAAEGNFSLSQVPAGDYELVAWLPNWIEAGHDRNPESACISRLFFRPPVERTASVHVTAGEESTATLIFQEGLFAN